MGGKPRVSGYRKDVLAADKTTSWLWLLTLSCNHVVSRIAPGDGSKWPPNHVICNACAQRDRDIVYHRTELERLERDL
jgi:hypothetical protein